MMVQFRDRRWSWGLIAGPACAIVIAYVVSLPFAPTVSLAGVLSWLAGSYASGQSLTDATSVNAYNVWTLWWLVTPDSRLLLGLRLHAWGWLAFAAIAVAVIWRLSRRLAAESDRVLREQLIARASFIMLVALFMFATRMHERYILYALTLVPLMWFCGRSERWTAVTLLVTFTLCVILVLGFYEHDRFHEIPIVTHLLSLINLVALFVVLRSFFSGPSDRRRDRQFVQRRTSSRTVAS
ncbi:MAG: hypothetical protein IAI50_02215 [Candidatus Eremiobacteraeota bacterium]|nr:hypothetical protein [Candidatus Eremiobacteraeota bacterium]